MMSILFFAAPQFIGTWIATFVSKHPLYYTYIYANADAYIIVYTYILGQMGQVMVKVGKLITDAPWLLVQLQKHWQIHVKRACLQTEI